MQRNSSNYYSKSLLAMPWGMALAAALVVSSGDAALGQKCCQKKMVEKDSCDIAKQACTTSDFSLDSLQIGEARANTFTHSLQDRACLDVDPDGNLLVVWDSRRLELGSYGVAAQLFDPLGRRIGTEIHVNEYMPNAQHEPALAFDKSGQAWIAWESYNQDGDGSGIYLRRFGRDANGDFKAMSSESLVNTTTSSDQFDPSVTVNGKGNVIVTWSYRNADADNEIHTMARIYDSNGQPATDEFRVDNGINSFDRVSTGVGLDDGRFVLAWSRTDAQGDPAGIFMCIVNPDGSLVSNEMQINDSTDGSFHIEPAIDADASGRFVVTWLKTRKDIDGYDVLAQRFDTNGDAVGDTMRVSPDTDKWISGSSVAMAEDGRFTISYNIHSDMDVVNAPQPEPVHPSTLMAQVYDANGNQISEAFQVNQMNEGQHNQAASSNSRRAVWSGMNQIAFAWDGMVDGDKSGIGLTVLAPKTLNILAPAVVEPRMACEGLTPNDVRVPPIPTENWVPQDPEIGIASVGPDFGFLSWTTTEWQPPDPDLAVGPDHIITVVNMRMKIHDKVGNELSQEYLEDFWGALGANYFVFDPVAQYDALADRFVIAAAEHEGGDYYKSHLDIAVSKTSNPLDGWNKYRFSLSSIGAFVDFENLGIGTDAYYLSADYFAGGGNQIHIFEKAPMLVGGAVTMKHIQTDGGQVSLGSTTNYDANAVAQYFATSYSGSNTSLKLHAVQNATGTPTLKTYNLTVPYFSNPPYASQKGSSNQISTVDLRIKHGVHRNGTLWLSHTIGENNTARVRWYEIAMNGWPNSGSNPSLTQSGTFNYGTGQHSWFPDISVDSAGDAVIVSNRSSSNDYVYIARTVRKAGDATGTFRESVRLQESDGAHTGGRWGDYSGVDEDPADPGVFWNHHEYNSGTGTNWRTWVGRVDTDKSMVLTTSDLTRGVQATLTSTGATPNGVVYFAYSFGGSGSTYVPFLNATLDIKNPTSAGSDVADAAGTAVLNKVVPNNAPLKEIWIQAIENKNTSNVVSKFIN